MSSNPIRRVKLVLTHLGLFMLDLDQHWSTFSFIALLCTLQDRLGLAHTSLSTSLSLSSNHSGGNSGFVRLHGLLPLHPLCTKKSRNNPAVPVFCRCLELSIEWAHTPDPYGLHPWWRDYSETKAEGGLVTLWDVSFLGSAFCCFLSLISPVFKSLQSFLSSAGTATCATTCKTGPAWKETKNKHF